MRIYLQTHSREQFEPEGIMLGPVLIAVSAEQGYESPWSIIAKSQSIFSVKGGSMIPRYNPYVCHAFIEPSLLPRPRSTMGSSDLSPATAVATLPLHILPLSSRRSTASISTLRQVRCEGPSTRNTVSANARCGSHGMAPRCARGSVRLG